MAYTKYSLTPANNTAAPPDGAPEGMLPSAVNDTMRDMMAQIRDVGDGIRDGTYTMTAPKITGGTITGSTINNSAIGGTTAAAGAFTTLSASGVSTFSAGTVSLPAITTTGDTNTGIFFPAADTIAFTEGGVEAMRIDSSGNVGIGTSSPAANSLTLASKVVAMTTGYGISWNSGATQLAGYDTNILQFITNSAERMRIDTSGNVGIGTSSPVGLLDVVSSGSGVIRMRSSTGSGTVGFQAQNNDTGTTSTDGTFYGIDGSEQAYVYNYENAPLIFGTNNAERMRIDSSGNVGIGTSSPNATCRLDISQTSRTRFDVSTATVINTVTNAAANAYATLRIDSADYQFYTGGSEKMRIDSSGNVGIGTTAPQQRLGIKPASNVPQLYMIQDNVANDGWKMFADSSAGYLGFLRTSSGSDTERMRITSGGDFMVAMSSLDPTTSGFYVNAGTLANTHTVSSNTRTDGSGFNIMTNRQGSDGTIIEFRQANTTEGSISVSGTTVSYNGGHLSRYAQTTTAKDDSLLKGTVLSNLDEMNEYVDAEGNPVDNEQLNKVKVSDVEGDVNVAGVFVNWSHDEAHDVDEINMAMTGDMIIRIAEGVVVQKGDLLMSAGDGTAKPQGDDIVRSKTIAKVTSNHVTCTYADGSYCVPCVLMAC